MEAKENLNASDYKENYLSTACSTENPIQIELDVKEKAEIYKKTIWSNLLSVLPNINEYIKPEEINSFDLYNNITKVNSNGVVQLLDKSEDLPHWILSAMKCLVNCIISDRFQSFAKSFFRSRAKSFRQWKLFA